MTKKIHPPRLDTGLHGAFFGGMRLLSGEWKHRGSPGECQIR